MAVKLVDTVKNVSHHWANSILFFTQFLWKILYCNVVANSEYGKIFLLQKLAIQLFQITSKLKGHWLCSGENELTNSKSGNLTQTETENYFEWMIKWFIFRYVLYLLVSVLRWHNPLKLLPTTQHMNCLHTKPPCQLFEEEQSGSWA